MALLNYERYYIAHDALMILTLVPSIIIFLCSLCMARRRSDPARTGFTYLKAAFALFIVFVFFDICGYAVAFAYSRWRYDTTYSDVYSDSSDRDTTKALFMAQVNCWSVSRLFDAFTDIFVFLMLVRISTGIIIAKSGAPDALGKILRFASYGIAVLLAALDIAQFAVRMNFYNSHYKNDVFLPDDDSAEAFTKSRQVDFSFRVLVFILALVVVGRSVMVKMQSRNEPRVATASNFLLGCAALWLLRTTYNMAIYAAMYDLSDARKDHIYKSYPDITDVVLAVWPQFILLCIAFFLGTKKRNGLWSTNQPFMVVNPGQQQTAWGYGDGGHIPPKHDTPPMPMQQQQYQPPPQQQGYYPPPLEQQYQQGHFQQQQPQYQQPPQQQAYYPPPQQTQAVHQHQYSPEQQQPYQPPQHYGQYDTTPGQTRSPPPHEDTMGLNHQADGTPPQVHPQPYMQKQ